MRQRCAHGGSGPKQRWQQLVGEVHAPATSAAASCPASTACTLDVDQLVPPRAVRTQSAARPSAIATDDTALVLQGQMYGRASLTCDDASPVFPATRHFSSI